MSSTNTGAKVTRQPARLVGAADGYTVHADSAQYIVARDGRTVGYFGSLHAALECIVRDSVRRGVAVTHLRDVAEAVALTVNEAVRACRRIADGGL